VGPLIGWLLLGLTGIIGFNEKKPSLISSRISMGIYGSYLITVFNIVQLIGWAAIMLIQCARSLQPITAGLLGINNFTLIVVFVGILVAIWALYIDKGINQINNIAVILLGILSVVMLVLVIKGGSVNQSTMESMSLGAAFELSIVMPLSWVPLISDYTMNGKSAKGSFGGSFAGYFAGSSFMYITGLVTAAYTGNSDPVNIMAKLGLGYIALLIVILATVTTTFLDIYSSVMSTLNLAPRLSKKNLIIIFTALGTLLALFFPMEQYENFLYMIGSIFSPAFSVIIVDYFFYKKDRSKEFVNLPGIIAAVCGTLSYYIVIRYDFIIGSSIPTMAITVTLYVILRYIIQKVKLGEKENAKFDF
jgi:putative hydroxymethylpyrimidine transporter CytX